MGRPPAPGSHLGTVEEFDPRRGLGSVTDQGDGSTFCFHATAIADGSRRIEVGTPVRFVVEPAHLGRYEARQLVELPPGAVTDPSRTV